MDEIIEKYTDDVIKNIDRYNMSKIIDFLEKEQCDFIEDIITDYLDLLTIDYELFVAKYNKLNEKYCGSYLKYASEDMNLFEEFFFD